jgi:hypothetical protein
MGVQLYELSDSGGTTQSGFWATNTLDIHGAILRHLFVDFGENKTSFEFKIVDNKNRNVVYLSSCNTILNRNYELPLKGIYTIMISNATVDNYFQIRFASQDVY